MSVYIIPVASGNEKELNFMELALNAMFMMEFRVDEHSKANNELWARSYTEDEVSDIRKPKLLRAAGELKNRYNLACDVNQEGVAKTTPVEIERFASFDEAVAECDLDAFYCDIVTCGKQAKPNFEMQYKFIYGKAPTAAQLKAYEDFMTGKITMFKFAEINEAEQNVAAPVKA